jgi:hypothetical protein
MIWIVERERSAAVVSADRDLADDAQPIGVGVERFADHGIRLLGFCVGV